MSTRILVARNLANALAPTDAEGLEYVQKLKPGQPVWAEIKRARNLKFHRKYFALLNLGFEYWETSQRLYRGQPVQKNFERYRHDVAILAGFYDPVFNLRGELRLEPKSIAFGNMSDDEFDRLYQKTIQVLLDHVLAAKGFDAALVNQTVDQLLRFGD